MCPYVVGFAASPVGPVPQLATRLTWRDRLGTLRARLGLRRNAYRVAPGLYCVGAADAQAPVLVTANYKLTLDCLRENLAGIAAWILVLDTRGINVWCAAAHQTFGTAELVWRLQQCGLAQVVEHRRLIVPQLGAAGVSARRVFKESGFTVVWGPLRALDLPRFLLNGGQVEPAMRELSFSLPERLLLIPVELALALKPTCFALLAIFGLSGIGPGIFSSALAWSRGLLAASAFLTGLLAGTVVVPLLLPWLPGRAFYRKGLLAALPLLALLARFVVGVSGLEIMALSCLGLAVSSYGAMNFTGATPYASPSGVEKEMRQGIPLQIGLLLVALLLWLWAPFRGGGL
ncbi:MAG: hypothetical protein HGA96_07155 [Desulfobulbaceae bacterium]|nr:hypothetical protein [Desulfobulbaceae bacterium]